MKMKKFGGTERVVYDLVKPIADEFGYTIWDVCFEKEGAYWYLRVFIDHPDGITIEDCEKMTFRGKSGHGSACPCGSPH